MDMIPIIARIKRASGPARVVPMEGQTVGLFKIEAQYPDGYQTVLENVTRSVADHVIMQAKTTKQVIID